MNTAGTISENLARARVASGFYSEAEDEMASGLGVSPHLLTHAPCQRSQGAAMADGRITEGSRAEHRGHHFRA
jgi:hypothetical protein